MNCCSPSDDGTVGLAAYFDSSFTKCAKDDLYFLFDDGLPTDVLFVGDRGFSPSRKIPFLLTNVILAPDFLDEEVL